VAFLPASSICSMALSSFTYARKFILTQNVYKMDDSLQTNLFLRATMIVMELLTNGTGN